MTIVIKPETMTLYCENCKDYTPWKPVSDPPKQGELVVVAAWEFGCKPMLFFARMWQSTMPNQPQQWYLAPELYLLDRPRPIGSQVRCWMPIPELPEDKQLDLFSDVKAVR